MEYCMINPDTRNVVIMMIPQRMVEIKCPDCIGTGYFMGHPCPLCEGRGFIIAKIDNEHYQEPFDIGIEEGKDDD